MIDPLPLRGPFAQAYGLLRDQLTAGRLRPGAQVKMLAVAAHLRISTTPVREALYRLIGEELIEERRPLGYFVPRLRARALGDLYDLRRLYLDIALANGPLPARLPEEEGELFRMLVHAVRNPALTSAFLRTDARLAGYRAAEARVLAEPGLPGPVGADPEEMRRAIAAYHDRRAARAAEIADEAEDPADR